MSAYTKGPWLLDGLSIYALEREPHRTRGMPEYRNRFYAGVGRGPDTPDEELEANAKLIAAAPDLADALDWMLDSAADCTRCCRVGHDCVGHAALRKAGLL